MTGFIARLVARENLSESEAGEATRLIMEGSATPIQIAGFLVALRMKGETADEITGMARTLRELAVPVPIVGDLLDTCGTGGDGSGTFNISTLAAIVAAGAGAKVAKHGNRSASSKCGSADVLEEVGIRVEMGPEAVVKCVQEVGIGFLYARSYHPSFRHVAAPRAELGIRTVFNIVGPLCNPAHPTRQSIGLADPGLMPILPDVLLRLGVERLILFHGAGGLDELTIAGPSRVIEVLDGTRREYQLDPTELGLDRAAPEALVGGGAAENAAIMRQVLDGERGPRRDVVVLNAASALVAAGVAGSWKEGVALAAETIDQGKGAEVLSRWVDFSRALDS